MPERAAAGIHYVDSGMRRFEKTSRQGELIPKNERVDTAKSSQEVIIFNSSPSRIWLRKDDATIIQIYRDNTVDWFKVRDNERKAAEAPGDDLTKLQQEFRIKYAKECDPLTRKYLEALSKKQKQLVQEGNMEEAIAIHEYLKKFGLDNQREDRILKGIWKDRSGCSYDFSDKSKVVVKKPDGTLKSCLIYTSTSPRGEWKMAHGDRGPEKEQEVIIFSTGDKTYIIPNHSSSSFSILTRVSGS